MGLCRIEILSAGGGAAESGKVNAVRGAVQWGVCDLSWRV